MNLWDVIITVGIAAAVTAAVFVIVKNKKRGKRCCGDCSQCGGCARLDDVIK